MVLRASEREGARERERERKVGAKGKMSRGSTAEIERGYPAARLPQPGQERERGDARGRRQ